jgi:hypothetical protein
MSGPLITVSRWHPKPGRLNGDAADPLGMLRDIEEAEPRLLAFQVYATEDQATWASIQIHPDAESFEYHLKLFGERVGAMIAQIEMDSFDVYGPTPAFIDDAATHGGWTFPTRHAPVHVGGFTRLRDV